MKAGADSDRVKIPVVLQSEGATVEATASVPDALLRPADLVPLLLGVTEAVVALAVNTAERAGRSISCRAGCGACCRQLVPISEAEAFYLATLVAEMPAAKQVRIRQRFQDALAALGDDLVARLREAAGIKDREARRVLGEEYFARGVACPFLESESCSIHARRPAVCREYLVTSPASNCSRPAPGSIEPVAIPVRPSTILYCFGDGIGNETTRWIPLVLALEWAESRRAEPQRTYDAPQMFRNFIAQIARWGSTPGGAA